MRASPPRSAWSPTIALASLAVALATLSGCVLFVGKTPTPIPSLPSTTSPGGSASTLIVFLHGRGGSVTDFEKYGFAEILKEAAISADIVSVNSHLGYYIKRTIVDRLWTDILQPARKQGYKRIVLVGLSLGGLGALLTEREHPGAVDTLVLIAPYLGDNTKLFARITSVGGPAAWAAGRDLHEGGVEEQIWTFLGLKYTTLPPTWLLYGKNDPLAIGHDRLASLLPTGRVLHIEGGHDWPTWRALWRKACFHTDLFHAEKPAQTGPAPTQKAIAQ